MAAVGPVQIVGNNVAVLFFDGGLVPRAANSRGAVTEADRRQTADVRSERNSGKAKLLRNIYVVVQIEVVGTQVIEAEAKFIDEVVAKSMNLAGGQASS